jgi:hypothetical protein
VICRRSGRAFEVSSGRFFLISRVVCVGLDCTLMCSFVAVGPLFGGGFGGSSGAYAFSVPGLPPAAHALAKTSFLFDHGNYAIITLVVVNHPGSAPRHAFMFLFSRRRDKSKCPSARRNPPNHDLTTLGTSSPSLLFMVKNLLLDL